MEGWDHIQDIKWKKREKVYPECPMSDVPFDQRPQIVLKEYKEKAGEMSVTQ